MVCFTGLCWTQAGRVANSRRASAHERNKGRPQGGRWEAKEGQQRSIWHLSSFTFLLCVLLILSTCTREPLPPKLPLLQTQPDIEKHTCALFLWFCCNWNSATPESSWRVSWRGAGNPPVFRRLPGHPGVITMSVEGESPRRCWERLGWNGIALGMW